MSEAIMPGGRGMEQHGVEAHGAPELVDDWELGDPVVVPPKDEAPVPVPVRIVNEGAKDRRMFRTFRLTLQPGSSPVCVAGLDENRTKITLQGLPGEEHVVVSSDANTADSMSGFLLVNGQQFSTGAESAVWVAPRTGNVNPATVCVAVEYTVKAGR